MDGRRGSSSEEPLPHASARGERRDNVACPGDHREAATSAEAPRHHCGWTDVGLELRGALTSAASPKDERGLATHNATSAARDPPVLPPAEIPSPSREVAFEEAPGSSVQVHRQSSRARSTSDLQYGRCRPAVRELYRCRQGPRPAGRPNHRTTPHAPSRSPLARSSEDCVPRLESSHSPAVPAHPRAARRPPSDEKLRPASCHLRSTPVKG
jgi:hypothetical protein